MRIAMMPVEDIDAARSLSARLLENGCIGDQVLVITKSSDLDDHTEQLNSRPGITPSLQLMLQSEENAIFAIAEPQYYSSGIRDNRQMDNQYNTLVEQLALVSAQLKWPDSTSSVSVKGPLVNLRLGHNKQEAREQLKTFLQDAKKLVTIIDIPSELEQGSFHVIHE